MKKLAFLPLVALAFAAACDSPAALQPADDQLFNKDVAAGASQDELLKSLKQATARFHSTTQAIKAGYQPNNHCVAVPGLGGMGYHWANRSLTDPDFNPTQPEVLLYAPDRNGNLKLVAVEFVVINVGQPRPSFGGHLFDINGVPPLQRAGVPHWSLHVWLYEDNPNGIFTPFNPNISCP